MASYGPRRLALAATVLAVLGLPQAADGAVSIGARSIRVTAPGARATVARDPFRISFADGTGHTVLSEVANAGPAPFPSSPVPEPAPAGVDQVRPPTLYSPLTFTVGAERAVQDVGTEWEGNVLLGAQAGIEYSARNVVAARRQGAGVELTLSTNDPSGRQLKVIMRPADSGRALAVSAAPTDLAGVAALGDSFGSSGDEAFHGFGGRHDYLDQHGQVVDDWTSEENFGAGPFQPAIDAVPGTGGYHYLFPNGEGAAYYPQPLFLSSHRYGFLLANSELSRFRLDADRPDAWNVSAAAADLRYLVAPGGAPAAIRTLTRVNGRQPAPPAWALDPMTTVNLTAQDLTDPAHYEQRLRNTLTAIDRYHLSFSGFDIEGWSELPPAFLRQFIAELRRRGIHPTIYFVPWFSATSVPAQKGYVARTPTGAPYIYPSPFGALTLLDFSNPAAVSWWQSQIKAGLDLGADGFMEDWGEQVQVDMRFADGESGAQMHNRYPVLYHEASRAAVDQYERLHHGRGIFFYTRSGFAGEPGSAAFEGANFPGDENADWSRSNGLGALATDMLNRGIGGAVGYSTDTGGYIDSYSGAITKELYLRWVEWATLSPMLRIHNSVSNGTYQPWSFDAQALAIYRRYARLRRRAAPLIMRLWRHADQTGIPITRPLWLEYPHDRTAAVQDEEWMLGPNVLVAPVVTEGAASREVYFPSGCWRSPDTGITHRGPGSARVAAPLARLPYYLRCGTRPFAPGPHGARARARRTAEGKAR